MNIPPGSETTRREAEELAARFSALSTEISACLDAVLGELQRAPNNERAIGVARELVSAQRTVTQQLMTLARASGNDGLHALGYAETPAHRLLPAPNYTQPAARADPHEDYPGSEPAGSLLHLLQQHAVPPPDVWQSEPASSRLHGLSANYRAPTTYDAMQQQSVPLQPSAHWHAQHTAPAPQTYARVAPAPRYTSQPSEPERYTDDDVDEPSAPRVAATRPQRASPLAVATMLGSARRSSPTRLAAVVLPMIVVLGLMLNAGQRTTRPVAPQAEAVVVAAPGTKPTRDARVPAQEPHQSEPDAQNTQNETFEAGSAQAAEVASYNPPAVDQPIAGTITASLPPAPEKLPQGEIPEPQTRSLAMPSPAVARTQAPAESPSIPVPPVPRAKPAMDTPKIVMLTPPSPTAKALPAQVKPSAGDAAKPARDMAKIAPFKTAVVKTEPSDVFVPVLLELKSESSLRQIFQDLQKRYPGSLGTKHAELRPVAGPQNEKWFALLAAPGVAKADADTVCQTLGQEGKSLGCRVIRY